MTTLEDECEKTTAVPATSRLLFVSRSAPPAVSGSAHVLKALLEADQSRRLVAVGGRPTLGREQPSAANLRRLRSELSVFGRGARFLAPVRELIRPWVTARLLSLAKDPRIDRVVCVFPDAFYCEASLVAARAARKPIDFWFHNTYADNRSGIAGRRADVLERRLVEAADRLFFINDALRDRFASKYPAFAAKCSVLRHPVAEAGRTDSTPRGFRSTPVRALLMGNLNESNMDAATRMVRALGGRDDLWIRVCTPVPKALLAARGMDLNGVEYLGYVSDSEMSGLLEDSDLFLLPHGLAGGYSQEEYRTIFPTRAAHYLAQAKPILAHSPAGSGLTNFLEQNQCAVTVTAPSEFGLLSAFEALRDDSLLQISIARNAAKAGRGFDPANILRGLLETRVAP